MDKNTSPLLLAALTSFNLESDSQGWTKLLPFGQFRAVDGRPFDAPFWNTDNQIGAALASNVNAQKNSIIVDYEHQTLLSASNGQPAPAAGWIKPSQVVWRDNDGLYAKIDWTEKATAHIAAHEYKYMSPVFLHEKSGDVSGFVNMALTNNPALDCLGDLTAALSKHFNIHQNTEQKHMNKELHALLCATLALSENASEEQIQTALTQSVDKITDGKGLAACSMTLPKFIEDNRAKIVALSAQPAMPDASKFVPIEAVTQMQQEIVALKQENETRKAQESGALIQTALKDGRLSPALQGWAEGLAKTDVAALSSYIATAPAIAALSTTQTGGLPPAGGGQGKLTEGQIAICKQMGLSQEDYIKSLNEDEE